MNNRALHSFLDGLAMSQEQRNNRSLHSLDGLARTEEQLKSLIDSTVQNAIQQRIAEHEENNMARHPLHPDLPPEISTRVLPLGTVRLVVERKQVIAVSFFFFFFFFFFGGDL